MSKLRVLISSVQKELENERRAVLSLISTDPFLQAHFEPVLYEFERASPEKAADECLALLNGCDICLSIIWKEYGSLKGAPGKVGRSNFAALVPKSVWSFCGILPRAFYVLLGPCAGRHRPLLWELP